LIVQPGLYNKIIQTIDTALLLGHNKYGLYEKEPVLKHNRLFFLFILAALLAFPISTVSAHRPGWGEEGKITEIGNIGTSYAFYRDLQGRHDEPIPPTGAADFTSEAAATAGSVDIYSFQAQAGQNLYTQVNIPAIHGLENYGVSLALVGPGLPVGSIAGLPVQPPDPSLGALIIPSRVTADFFEPFTQTNYWGRQEINQPLPQTGTYYLLVWNPQGLPGKYVLATGTAEVFGPTDLFRFPLWWVRVHLYYGHGPYFAAAGALIALIIGLIFWRRSRIKKNTHPAGPQPG
jgi:hypothetical protein